LDLWEAKSLQDLALVLGCNYNHLIFYLYRQPIDKQYTTFDIPKRRGGSRRIASPVTNLKLIQRSIASELVKVRTFKPCVTGFLPERNIQQNAAFHVKKRLVLNLDLEDFFGSITFPRVYGLLLKPLSLSQPVAASIAKATTRDGSLP
jgi:RNA-directed DNA polymerase